MRKAFKGQKEIERLNKNKKNLGKKLNQDKNRKEINLLKKKRVAKDILSDKNKVKSRDKRIFENILENKN